MALEQVLIYRIVTGDSTYPHAGSFTFSWAGTITIDDSNGSGDTLFGDLTHTGGADVPDQNVTASTVAGITVGNTVDSRYFYTITGSDGTTGRAYFIATNSSNNYGPLFAANFKLTPGVTYTFGAFNTDGGVAYTSLIHCFANGTLIETQRGSVAVEYLRAGDCVRTLDNGFQPIRWIATKTLDSIGLTLRPKLRPIRIRAGALGPGVPISDLILSPQHRVLIQSPVVRRMFAEDEVLVAANKLLGVEGVERMEDINEVTYFHILFDDHQIIFSNGAATESLFLGTETLNALTPEARVEIELLFPALAAAEAPRNSARPILKKGPKVRSLVERHAKNGQALQQPLSANEMARSD